MNVFISCRSSSVLAVTLGVAVALGTAIGVVDARNAVGAPRVLPARVFDDLDSRVMVGLHQSARDAAIVQGDVARLRRLSEPNSAARSKDEALLHWLQGTDIDVSDLRTDVTNVRVLSSAPQVRRIRVMTRQHGVAKPVEACAVWTVSEHWRLLDAVPCNTNN